MSNPTPRSTPASLRPLADAFRRLEDHLGAEGKLSLRTKAKLERVHMEIEALARCVAASESRTSEAA